MASTTVAQLAAELSRSAAALLEQLQAAGVGKATPEDIITESDKTRLLDYLKRSHGQADDSARKKITLTKRETSEIRQSDATGKTRTVQVEVRKKRVLIKRDDAAPETHADGAEAQPQVIDAAEEARREAEERRQAEQLARQEAEAKAAREAAEREEAERRARQEALEAEQRRQAELAARKAEEEAAASRAVTEANEDTSRKKAEDEKARVAAERAEAQKAADEAKAAADKARAEQEVAARKRREAAEAEARAIQQMLNAPARVLKAPSERKAEEKKAEQTGTLHKPVKPAGTEAKPGEKKPVTATATTTTDKKGKVVKAGTSSTWQDEGSRKKGSGLKT
ncbi:MAG: translation initiation factor IF-2, partial [Cupriavidus sp.]|nr:translation initiation factor IF-2 [Cupriavidus sp.]